MRLKLGIGNHFNNCISDSLGKDVYVLLLENSTSMEGREVCKDAFCLNFVSLILFWPIVTMYNMTFNCEST